MEAAPSAAVRVGSPSYPPADSEPSISGCQHISGRQLGTRLALLLAPCQSSSKRQPLSGWKGIRGSGHAHDSPNTWGAPRPPAGCWVYIRPPLTCWTHCIVTVSACHLVVTVLDEVQLPRLGRVVEEQQRLHKPQGRVAPPASTEHNCGWAGADQRCSQRFRCAPSDGHAPCGCEAYDDLYLCSVR